MSIPFHQQQLEFMTHLANSRIEILDPLFRFLNYFDSPYFFFILIPVLLLGYSYQWGLRIFYWFTFNSLMTSYMKYLFSWPRPSTDDPALGMYHPANPGFPSGGAQMCLFLGILFIYYWRMPLAWIIGLVYILAVSFSRLYLGVHYPIDILGGWVVGAIIAILFIVLKEPIEKFLAKRGPLFSLFISLAIPLFIMWLVPKKSVFYIMGSTMGVGLGAYFSFKYRLLMAHPKNLMEGVGRSIIGIAATFLIVFLWPGGPSQQTFTKSFAAGLFLSLAASPICKWFLDKKLSNKSQM